MPSTKPPPPQPQPVPPASSGTTTDRTPEERPSTLLPGAAGEAMLALQKVVAAIGASDPATFYTSADAFEKVAAMLGELNRGITERSMKMFVGDTPGEGWQGEGAQVCSRIVGQFNDYLGILLQQVTKWPPPVREAGTQLQQTWYAVDAVLAKHSAAPPDTTPPPPAPTTRKTPETDPKDSALNVQTLSA
ncbi:hypothetical protein ABT160_10250 [Streptomyces sp. NPDC001941]|uniref:hypothetical protein n=1 Tax=Streptomyces sp. NPDC001941 TaxID=3154659 RepID=UPI00331E990C